MNSVHATTETVDRSLYPYRMKDLCEATGLPRQAIHFYIQEGLLPPGVKTGRNMAFYGEAHLERLKTIKRLQHERFLPLKAIKALLDDKSHHFDPVQWRFLADVKKSLKAELGDRDVAVETVDVGALAERLGVDLLDVEEAIEQGIVGVREEPDGRRVIAASDVWYFELWAEMRAIGFTRELGFTVADVAFYEEIVERLVARELELVSTRLASKLPPDKVAEMIERGLPVIHRVLMKSHLAKIQNFFASLG
ncbi:MAG: MerR family transcriptional regulator [Myxococcales bacterium]|nr:MerR family transcriptional regulator [Myxococcales bacterium]